MIWNVRDESVDWVAELTEIIDPHSGDAPRYRTGAWREAFDRTLGFGPLNERRFRYEQAMTPDGVVDRVLSVSFIAALPDYGCRSVREQVGRLLLRYPDLAGRDEIAFPYRTDVYWCERR